MSQATLPSTVAEEAPPPAATPKVDEFAPYRWAPLKGKPKTYSRLLWGGESLYHQYAKVSESHSDTLSHIVISSASESFSPSAIQRKVLDAWLYLRYHAPLLGGKVEADVGVEGAPPHLGCFVYETTDDKTELEAWVKGAVTFSQCDTVEDFYPATERFRRKLTATPVGVEAKTHLYILSAPGKDKEGRYQHTIHTHGAHCILDGASMLRMHHVFFSLLAQESYDMQSLDWGRGDVDNLPPAAIEAAGLDPSIQDNTAMFQILKPILENYGPSMSVKAQRPFFGPSDGGTTQIFRYLEPSLVEAITRNVKSRGKYNVTHAIDTARHTAVWYLRAREAARTGEPISEKYITNLLLPIDASRAFVGKWKDALYVCSAVAGFTTSVPIEFFKCFDVTGDPEEVQQTAFDALFPVLSKQYGGADLTGAMTGMETAIQLMGVRAENPIQLRPQGPSDAFTSIGVVDKPIPAGYDSDGKLIATHKEARERGIYTFDDFCPAPRLAYSQTCLHTWSRQRHVGFCLNFTDEYDRSYMEEFIDLIVAVLTRVARGKGSVPAIIPNEQACRDAMAAQ